MCKKIQRDVGRMKCDGESRYNKEQMQARAGTRVTTRVRVRVKDFGPGPLRGEGFACAGCLG